MEDESATTGTRPKTKSGIALKLKRCDQGKAAKMSDTSTSIEEKKAEMKSRVLQICSIQEKAASIQETAAKMTNTLTNIQEKIKETRNIQQTIENARKTLAEMPANVERKDLTADGFPTVRNVNERIMDAAVDASAKGHMERASELAAQAIARLTPDRMQAYLHRMERQKARLEQRLPLTGIFK